LQKEIYFNPSVLKNADDLQWLSKSSSGNLWIYAPAAGQEAEAEDMLISKLITNPRVFNSTPDQYAILKYTGTERFHFVRRHHQAKKIVLFGVNPSSFGIHIKMPEYAIVPHLGYYFLWVDAAEKMPGLPAETKGKIVGLLKKLESL